MTMTDKEKYEKAAKIYHFLFPQSNFYKRTKYSQTVQRFMSLAEDMENMKNGQATKTGL